MGLLQRQWWFCRRGTNVYIAESAMGLWQRQRWVYRRGSNVFIAESATGLWQRQRWVCRRGSNVFIAESAMGLWQRQWWVYFFLPSWAKRHRRFLFGGQSGRIRLKREVTACMHLVLLSHPLVIFNARNIINHRIILLSDINKVVILKFKEVACAW
jgi:hypothetical protein